MMGVTKEPEAVYEPVDTDVEAVAEERHDRCAHAKACDRAADMHTVESTWNWLYCEKCELYERGE